MRAHVSTASIVAATLLSCGGDDRYRPPIAWEGEYLRFGTDEEPESVCAGTLPYSDDVVGYLANVFGVSNPEIDFYWTPEDLECGAEDAIGCTNGSAAWSKFPFHQHELVHAVRDGDLAYPPLEEGLAEAFGDSWDPWLPLAGDAAVLWETHQRGSGIEGSWYPVAGHYVSFLRAAYGTEALLQLVETSDHFDSWDHTQLLFEDVYGDTFAETIDEYRDYPGCNQTLYRDNGFDCGNEAIRVADVGEPDQEIRVSLDCGDSAVVGPARGERWTTLTLEVPTTRLYEFGAAKFGGNAAGRLRVRECGQSCFDEDSFRFAFDLDLPPDVDGQVGAVTTCIDAGRYTMRLAIDEDDTGEFVVRFAPRTLVDDGMCDLP
jgi:hypothetical protein